MRFVVRVKEDICSTGESPRVVIFDSRQRLCIRYEGTIQQGYYWAELDETGYGHLTLWGQADEAAFQANPFVVG